jgi:hypothetical protein
METLAKTFSLLSTCVRQSPTDGCLQFLQTAIDKMIRPILILCGAQTLTFSDNINRSFDGLSTFQLSSTWLTPDLAALSLRAFERVLYATVAWHWSQLLWNHHGQWSGCGFMGLEKEEEHV